MTMKKQLIELRKLVNKKKDNQFTAVEKKSINDIIDTLLLKNETSLDDTQQKQLFTELLAQITNSFVQNIFEEEDVEKISSE